MTNRISMVVMAEVDSYITFIYSNIKLMVYKKMPRKLPNLTKNEHLTNTLF